MLFVRANNLFIQTYTKLIETLFVHRRVINHCKLLMYIYIYMCVGNNWYI